MIRFIARRSEQPEVCGVCFRVAGHVCTVEPRIFPGYQWMCNLCNANVGMKVAIMNPLRLEEAEAAAFDTAIEQNLGNLVSSIMGVLWENGIRDLDALAGERFDPLVEKIFNDGAASQAIAKIFLAYSNKIRKDMINATKDVPF